MISVGIDISKEKCTVCFLQSIQTEEHSQNKLIAAPYDVPYTKEDTDALIQRISSSQDSVKIVMESTGKYHLPLLFRLKQANLFVSIINPLIIRRYESMDLHRAKTDSIDAIGIARFGLDSWNHLADYQIPEELRKELKDLERQYECHMKCRIQYFLNLTVILDQVMPGITKLIRKGRAGRFSKDHLLDFVSHYKDYDLIQKQDEDSFIKDYQEWGKKKGYRVTKDKAEKIYTLAQRSILSMSSHTQSGRIIISEALRALYPINEALDNILACMQKLASQLPEYTVVESMKGVGSVLGPLLMAEVGNIHRFHSSGALIAYAGIDVPPYQSGKYERKHCRISKHGSTELRKVGYEIMACLKTIKPTEDAAVYNFILKKESEGKAKKVAKIAALNKFLRIYYARVKEVS